jgi:hypothetical protein
LRNQKDVLERSGRRSSGRMKKKKKGFRNLPEEGDLRKF